MIKIKDNRKEPPLFSKKIYSKLFLNLALLLTIIFLVFLVFGEPWRENFSYEKEINMGFGDYPHHYIDKHDESLGIFFVVASAAAATILTIDYLFSFGTRKKMSALIPLGYAIIFFAVIKLMTTRNYMVYHLSKIIMGLAMVGIIMVYWKLKKN